jgi:hypothetical protein
MFGINDILLGGITPLAIAAAAFGLGWAASRCEGVAWSAGVVLGYAAGATALAAGNVGIGPALQKLISPSVAHEWTPMIALIAVAPSLLAAATGRGRWLRWLLAVSLCVAAPLWLLWGGKYLPSQELRESGFALQAWSVPQAVMVLGGGAAMIFLAWRTWEAVERESAPRSRSLLAVMALIGAAATVGLTGSFVYAQHFGMLAAAVGGCLVASWFLAVKSGPEAAAAPVIVLTGSLLLLAACYSELPPALAIGVAIAVTLAAGWIPWLSCRTLRLQLIVRSALCVVPLALVLWQAGMAFLATQRQQQEAAESNPYLNL